MRDRWYNFQKSGVFDVFEKISLASILIFLLTSLAFGYSVEFYTVKNGDTFSGIAEKIGVSAASLMDLNPMIEPDRIYVGQILKYTEPEGIFQTVDKNGSLWNIASEYFTTTGALLRYNPEVKKSDTVFPGERIFIPMSIICSVADKKTGTIWPVFGFITSPYGWRMNPLTNKRDFHPGVDIGASEGTPVFSAINGVVTYSGWMEGYGNLVQVFDGRMLTRYGHLSQIDCYVGEKVSSGELVGRVGSTGWSTGPHLHFEVRIATTPYNPLGYLPYVPWSGEGTHRPTPDEEGIGY